MISRVVLWKYCLLIYVWFIDVFIDKVIYEKKIPVTKTYTNSSGDVVMVCDSIEIRDRLKDLTKTDDFELKSVAGKKNHISILGFNKVLSKDDVPAQVMVH